jgi:hypothetical protein
VRLVVHSFDPGEIPVAMTCADDLGLTAFDEPLTRVDANRLQQAIPCRPIAGIGDDERLCNERSEQRDDAPRLDAVARANTFGSVERKAAGEDRETREEGALHLAEELVAPVDRRLQRGLPVEAPLGTARRRNRSSSRSATSSAVRWASLSGRELQGERDAVEAATDVDHGGLVTRENVGPPTSRSGPFDEELNRGRLGRCPLVGRQIERWNSEYRFALDAEPLAAGDEHLHVGTRREQGVPRFPRCPRAGARNCRARRACGDASGRRAPRPS